jgi:hypothetical protein
LRLVFVFFVFVVLVVLVVAPGGSRCSADPLGERGPLPAEQAQAAERVVPGP